jgi:hypothetical protein
MLEPMSSRGSATPLGRLSVARRWPESPDARPGTSRVVSEKPPGVGRQLYSVSDQIPVEIPTSHTSKQFMTGDLITKCHSDSQAYSTMSTRKNGKNGAFEKELSGYSQDWMITTLSFRVVGRDSLSISRPRRLRSWFRRSGGGASDSYREGCSWIADKSAAIIQPYLQRQSQASADDMRGESAKVELLKSSKIK